VLLLCTGLGCGEKGGITLGTPIIPVSLTCRLNRPAVAPSVHDCLWFMLANIFVSIRSIFQSLFPVQTIRVLIGLTYADQFNRPNLSVSVAGIRASSLVSKRTQSRDLSILSSPQQSKCTLTRKTLTEKGKSASFCDNRIHIDDDGFTLQLGYNCITLVLNDSSATDFHRKFDSKYFR